MRTGYLTTFTSGLIAVDRLLGRVHLGRAHAVLGVDDLALEVGEVDLVVVDDAQRAHPGRGQVERGRRAEPAGAQQQHLGVEQLELALEADLGHQQVARVALALLVGERARHLDVVAAVLPQRDAAGHRLDRLVAQLLLHVVGGEGRALAGRAVQDHARVLARARHLDARLQVAARHVHGARQVGLLVLVLLAHVDDAPRRCVAVKRSCTSRGIHLADALLRLLDQVGSGGHDFKKYSGGRAPLEKIAAGAPPPEEAPGRTVTPVKPSSSTEIVAKRRFCRYGVWTPFAPCTVPG